MAFDSLLLLVVAGCALLSLGLSILLLARLGRLDGGVTRADHEFLLATIEGGFERLERLTREETRAARGENAIAASDLRTEIIRGIAALGEVQGKAGETLRGAVETQLATLRKENGEKLDLMRVTVDEKLQGTLETRLTQSFQLVSGQLEAVHKGLGEMQTLAAGVGDLKRVLTNVKTRGSWGEVQLGALLEQVLTQDQYVTNAIMAPTGADRVEFAIRMPGQGEGEDVFLPIDAKFPIEDYERLQAAAEAGDAEGVESASRALETRLKLCAKDICEKYVHPPRTTDFAILFLPTEGLYAEALRRPGLADELHRSFRVTLAGPTTLTALLNSLQMGFRTLAIQKRSSEVWQVLGAVKTEFGKFEGALDGVHKKLQEATNKIGEAQRRSRVLSGSLRKAEALPAGEAAALIGMDESGGEPDIAEVQAQFFASTPDEMRR